MAATVRMVPIAMAIVALIAPSGVAAQQAQAASTVPGPAPLFLLIYERGPAWIEGKPMRQQKLGEHVAYMQKLIEEGRVVAGGPFGGDAGGMAILRASSLEEAQRVLDADPSLLNGTFIASVKQWTPYLDSRQPLQR